MWLRKLKNEKITADILINNDINDRNSSDLMGIADMNYYMFDTS